jgi:hypothetical protein
MDPTVARKVIIWESWGHAALRRFEVRVGLNNLCDAHKRVKKIRGRCRRSHALARAMLRRLLVLCREKRPEARA